MGETSRFSGGTPRLAKTGPLPNAQPEAQKAGAELPLPGMEMPAFWTDMMGADAQDLMEEAMALLVSDAMPPPEFPGSFVAQSISAQEAIADPVVAYQLLAAQDSPQP